MAVATATFVLTVLLWPYLKFELLPQTDEGEVRVFFYIDETGHVKTTRLDKSSGYAQLDEAALQVANLYRFSPALNRDTRVPVWVSFPVTFAVVR